MRWLLTVPLLVILLALKFAASQQAALNGDYLLLGAFATVIVLIVAVIGSFLAYLFEDNS